MVYVAYVSALEDPVTLAVVIHLNKSKPRIVLEYPNIVPDSSIANILISVRIRSGTLSVRISGYDSRKMNAHDSSRSPWTGARPLRRSVKIKDIRVCNSDSPNSTHRKHIVLREEPTE